MADGESVSDPGPGDDSKREIRTNVSLPARITTVSPLLDPATGKSFYRASEELCENISPSGAFVMTREPLPQGERILLEIDLPDGEEVATLGRVCWARARPPTADDPRLPGFGIVFLEGSRKNYDLFERYVEETTREQLAEAENSDSKEGQG